MALIGNYNIISRVPGKLISNVGASVYYPATQNPGSYRGRFYGETWTQGVTDKCSVPANYGLPYVSILAPKAGGIGSNLGIQGLGTISGRGAMGLYRTSTFSGSGDITNAQLGLIVSAVATLAGNSTINAIISGDLTLIANLAGAGNFTGALRALGNAVATINGTSTVTDTIRATGELIADITPYTPLSPESLASSLWNSIAANYNNPGTMGKALNSAGSAGDPWITDLSSYNTPGTAGKIVKDTKKDTGIIPAIL